MPQNTSEVALEPLLTDHEAETILRVHDGFLAKDRVGKGRIPFLRIGRAIRYRPADIRNFLKANLRAHTSDVA